MASPQHLVSTSPYLLLASLGSVICGLPASAQGVFEGGTTAVWGTPSAASDLFDGIGTSTLDYIGPADTDDQGNDLPRLRGILSGSQFSVDVDESFALGSIDISGYIPDLGLELDRFQLPLEFTVDLTAPASGSDSFVVTLDILSIYNQNGEFLVDQLSIPEAGSTVIEVVVDGQIYKAELLGYSEDGGQTIVSEFLLEGDMETFSGEFYAVLRLIDGPVTVPPGDGQIVVIPIAPADQEEPEGPTQEEINQAMGGIATTPNTTSTASVIAIACPVANRDQPGARFTRDCNNLIAVGAFAPQGSELNDQAIVALDSITPNQATAPLSSSRDSLGTQLRNVSTRLAALRSGAVGMSLQGLPTGAGLNDALGSEVAGLAAGLAEVTGGAASGDDASNTLFAFGDGRLGVFINGSLSSGDKDPTSNEDGFSFDGWGLTAGVDYRFTDSAILGLAVGYNSGSTDLDNNGGSLDTDGYSLSLYGTYYPDEHVYADAVITYGSNSYDQERNIRYRVGNYNVNQVASADYDSSQWSATIGAGYDIPRGPWTFTPVVQLQYLSADVDGYTERMSAPNAPGGGWGTRLGDMDQESLTSMLGFNVSHAFSTNWGVILPQLHLDWVHEYKNDAVAINGSFVDDPTSGVFGVRSDRPDSDYYNARLGVSAQLARGNSLFLYYNKVLGYRNLDLDSLGAGVRLTF